MRSFTILLDPPSNDVCNIKAQYDQCDPYVQKRYKKQLLQHSTRIHIRPYRHHQHNQHQHLLPTTNLLLASIKNLGVPTRFYQTEGALCFSNYFLMTPLIRLYLILLFQEFLFLSTQFPDLPFYVSPDFPCFLISQVDFINLHLLLMIILVMLLLMANKEGYSDLLLLVSLVMTMMMMMMMTITIIDTVVKQEVCVVFFLPKE